MASICGNGIGSDVADAALAWLSEDACPRAIVAAGARLIWANPRAAGLFDGSHGLELRDGAIMGAGSSRQREFSAVISAAAGEPSSGCIRQIGGDGWLLFYARALGVGASAMIGLTFVVADRDHRARFRHLDAAFRLTPMELRVLLDLLDGNDAESLASKHGVTVETTRSHIRSIYSKLGVNSRERLFARVQPFRAIP